jgi:hypothetical protein
VTGSGGSFVIASYNIQGKSHQQSAWQPQADKVINAVKTNNIGVIGGQEMQDGQRQYIVNHLGYGVFPSLDNKNDAGHRNENSILWDKDAFSMESSGIVPGVHYFCVSGGAPQALAATYVKLRANASDQEFYVFNTHDPASTASHCGANRAAQIRMENARTYAAFLRNLNQKEHLPMFFTGDFNSGYCPSCSGPNGAYNGQAQNLTYCILNQSGIMGDAYDVYKGRPFKCPNPVVGPDHNRILGGVDHVYLSKGVSVTGWKTIPKNQAGTDHGAIQVWNVTMPGSGSPDLSGDFAWPVAKSWWDRYKSNFLAVHTMISGTFTSPYKKGIADDISRPPVGTPEFAMVGGKVIKTNLCGSGDGMMIESNIQGGKLIIAYGHGLNPRFHVGDTVKAGQQILSLNGVGCKVTGPHLHVDMTFNGKHICPQDVFLAMGSGKTPELSSLTQKGIAPCGRS